MTLKTQLKEALEALERSKERERQIDDLLGRVMEAHELLKFQIEAVEKILKMKDKNDPVHFMMTVDKFYLTNIDKLLDAALYTKDDLTSVILLDHNIPPDTTLH